MTTYVFICEELFNNLDVSGKSVNFVSHNKCRINF